MSQKDREWVLAGFVFALIGCPFGYVLFDGAGLPYFGWLGVLLALAVDLGLLAGAYRLHSGG